MSLVMVACGARFVTPDTPVVAAEDAVPLREDELEAALMTDPALVQFIGDLEQAVMKGDGEVLRAVVAPEVLMGRVMEGASGGGELAALQRGFVNGTMRTWKIAGALEAFSGHHYRFLRVRAIGEHQGLLFRSAEEDGQLNYHLHSLIQDEDGRYRVVDTYVVGLSESLSDTLRRGYEHLVANERVKAGKIDDEASVEGSVAFVANLEAVGKLGNALMNRRYAEALDLYHALPDGVQRVREVLLMRIEAAAKVSPLMLDEALDLWREEFGGDSLLPLKFIDYYMARGKYLKADQLARRVEFLTGGDAYLTVKRGELSFAVRNQMPPVTLSPRRTMRRGQAQGRK